MVHPRMKRSKPKLDLASTKKLVSSSSKNSVPHSSPHQGSTKDDVSHSSPHQGSAKDDCSHSSPQGLAPVVKKKTVRKFRVRRELKRKRVGVRSKVISARFNCHNIFIHFPKSGGCPICDATKTPLAQCRVKGDRKPDDVPEPKVFADRI